MMNVRKNMRSVWGYMKYLVWNLRFIPSWVYETAGLCLLALLFCFFVYVAENDAKKQKKAREMALVEQERVHQLELRLQVREWQLRKVLDWCAVVDGDKPKICAEIEAGSIGSK